MAHIKQARPTFLHIYEYCIKRIIFLSQDPGMRLPPNNPTKCFKFKEIVHTLLEYIVNFEVIEAAKRRQISQKFGIWD